eukprot:3534502-Pyramimonas_sp.AAC.2
MFIMCDENRVYYVVGRTRGRGAFCTEERRILPQERHGYMIYTAYMIHATKWTNATDCTKIDRIALLTSEMRGLRRMSQLTYLKTNVAAVGDTDRTRPQLDCQETAQPHPGAKLQHACPFHAISLSLLYDYVRGIVRKRRGKLTRTRCPMCRAFASCEVLTRAPHTHITPRTQKCDVTPTYQTAGHYQRCAPDAGAERVVTFVPHGWSRDCHRMLAIIIRGTPVPGSSGCQ